MESSDPRKHHPSVAHALQFFEYANLPPALAELSKPFHDLAHEMADRLQPNPETTVGLRKLLEAKDCMVRARKCAGIIALVFALLWPVAGCDPFDEDPEWYVQGLKPDLYYTLEVPQGAVAASVWFVTTKPTGPTLPVDVQVLTWAWPGGNIYDDSLADTTLTPKERENSLLFSGTVLFPPGGAQAIGVELRTFLNNVAWNAPLQSGSYCEADIMGAGILDCGAWIDAVLQLWVQCRNVVGALVRCDSLQRVLAPRIHLVGVRTEGQMADESPQPLREYPFFDAPEIFLYENGEGWWYRLDHRTFRRGSQSQGEAERGRGPFLTAEEAARDASERIPLPPRFWDEVLEVLGSDNDIGRAAAALSAAPATRARTRER